MEPPYRLLYRLGLTPWDRDQVPEPLTELVDELSAKPGRALDLGCGTGRDAVYLASRGWTVTGVDGVPRALERARQRAQSKEVEVNWALGDVTALPSLGIGEDYDLVLDRGCFHGLSEAGRRRCAEGITAIAGPNARILMNAFQPRGRGVGPAGVSPEELERHFHDGWELVSATPDAGTKLPRWLGDARPTWYRFERRA
jgi:SAM-dependent methyltransferase